MDQPTATPILRSPLPTGTGRLAWMVAVLAVLLFLVAAAFRFWAAQPSVGSQVMPTNAAIEARWGIRVTHVGISADGGLVDLRYIVLDPDKAVALLADVANLPVMRTEPDARLVNSAALMANKHDIAAGRTYFLLYRNTGGAIKPGSQITVSFGDLRLEHVPTQ